MTRHFAAADPKDHADTDSADGLDGGEQAGFIDVGHHLSVAAGTIERIEFAAALALAGEQLNYRDPADRFRQVGIERRDPIANLAIHDARTDAEKIDDQRERRNRA